VRYLAVDLGDRRTGLAVGDDETTLISPAGVIEIPRARQAARLVDAIRNAVEEHAAGAIVLGLPVNMDGTEGPRAALVREFGKALADAAGVPVEFQDERLTSYAADQRMAGSGRTHGQKKRLRDALAAAEILRDFLDARR